MNYVTIALELACISSDNLGETGAKNYENMASSRICKQANMETLSNH